MREKCEYIFLLAAGVIVCAMASDAAGRVAGTAHDFFGQQGRQWGVPILPYSTYGAFGDSIVESQTLGQDISNLLEHVSGCGGRSADRIEQVVLELP